MTDEARILKRLEKEAAREFRKKKKKQRKGSSCFPGKSKGLWKKTLPLFLYINLFFFVFPPFLVPVRGRFTSNFFVRQKPDSSHFLDFEFHRGLDIAAPRGALIRLSAPGIVAERGYSPGRGNFVRINHLLGFSTLYFHMSSINVEKGQLFLIRALASPGRVGSTGRSTGPHLHFEVRFFNVPLPPEILTLHHRLRRVLFRF